MAGSLGAGAGRRRGTVRGRSAGTGCRVRVALAAGTAVSAGRLSPRRCRPCPVPTWWRPAKSACVANASRGPRSLRRHGPRAGPDRRCPAGRRRGHRVGHEGQRRRRRGGGAVRRRPEAPHHGGLLLSGGESVQWTGAGQQPEYFMGGSADSAGLGMLDPGGFVVLFTPLELAQRLAGQEGMVNDLVVRLEPAADREEVAAGAGGGPGGPAPGRQRRRNGHHTLTTSPPTGCSTRTSATTSKCGT